MNSKALKTLRRIAREVAARNGFPTREHETDAAGTVRNAARSFRGLYRYAKANAA